MTVRAATFRFRVMMVFFIMGLVISGVTAFPLLSELEMLARRLGVGEATSTAGHTGLQFWILTVELGLREMYAAHPWIAYGTDWLAFGHIVIALFFVGPLIEPKGSAGVICAGMTACVLVVPLALICGSVRDIPFYWRLIDCSFGVIGIIPLIYCLRLLRVIESESAQTVG
jgi:hypothetical protein